MKFYHVVAKCGHVGGRGKYIDLDFYTAAESASQAAQYVRLAPRVKHHARDAIRSVEEITQEEFWEGQERYRNDPFTNCHSSQEQQKIHHLIADRICQEAPREERKTRERNPKRSARYGYGCDGRRERFDRYAALAACGL